MVIENRIKGLFINIIALILIIIFLVELFYVHTGFSTSLKLVYIPINLLLLIYGYSVFRKKRFQYLWEEYLIISVLIFQASVIIYVTDGINSHYFPTLFYIILLYTVLCKGRIFFSVCNLLVISSIIFWVFFAADSLLLLLAPEFILQLIIYLTAIIVMRNYRFECLSCNLDRPSCPYKSSCTLFKMKNKHSGDDYDVNELYQKS